MNARQRAWLLPPAALFSDDNDEYELARDLALIIG